MRVGRQSDIPSDSNEWSGMTLVRSFGAGVIDRLEAFDGSDLVHRPTPEVWSRPVSGPGVTVGVLCVALALFPSMLPKNGFMQGVVLGITFMVGYALGAGWQWLWRFLELPSPGGRPWRVVTVSSTGLIGLLLAVTLWRHIGWQNAVRAAFGMEEVSPLGWMVIGPVSSIVAGVILVAARALRRLFNVIARWFDRHLPRRLALLIGSLTFSVLLWGLWSQVLVDGFFAGANWISAPIDESTDAGITPPLSSNRSGSPESFVEWDTLGRQGRKFVATGATVDELNAFHGAGALEPIRVYVGLKSADTMHARAGLLLDELIRTGAFDRDVLVVAATTGTGYLDPRAMDALDYLTNGDLAVAAFQYSYLPSSVSLLADSEEVAQTSQVVFDTIHQYWAALPEPGRPEIYLYGLSLGSFGVESILTSIDIVNEPIDGALLVGPPFVNELRNKLVSERDAGSTPTAPVYDGGRTVRFADEDGIVTRAGGDWGPTRVLYLQHATDPVVFYTPNLLLERPQWLDGDHRSAELNHGFTWIPFVTMWQVLTDLAAANSMPDGFGHVYSRQAHVASWAAVLQPEGWTDADTHRLQQYFDGT